MDNNEAMSLSVGIVAMQARRILSTPKYDIIGMARATGIDTQYLYSFRRGAINNPGPEMLDKIIRYVMPEARMTLNLKEPSQPMANFEANTPVG